MPRKFVKLFIVSTIIISLLVLTFLVGFGYGNKDLKIRKQISSGKVLNEQELPEYLGKDVDFKEFWQIWEYVKENYVKSDVPETQLFYGALAGIVASLRDPYSVFLNPEISKKFEEELSGSFEGIGAEIGIKEEELAIIAPLPGTPADKAGLRAGDKVLAIDGLDTAGMALEYAVNKIRGPKGSQVTLSILSNGDEKPREVTITRDKIEIDSVRFIRKEKDTETGNYQTEKEKEFVLMDDGVAYLELLYFNENTLADWNKSVEEIIAANPKGIILDLRNNPGGFLQTAIEIAGEWIDGKTVVMERLRSGTKIEHKARRKARFEGIPTVVLVNRGSASGSEIVAGALQDYGAAVIVGETTFGKGSVQDYKEFKDGSAVKLTIAEWLTPKGKNINEEGIKPTIEVKMTREDYDSNRDPQLDRALEILK